MNAIAFVSALISGFYVLSAVYVVKAQPRSPTNRLFAVINLLFAWWAGCLAFIVTAPTREQAWFWYRLSPVGWTVAPAALLHFFLLLSERRKLARVPFLLAIYCPAAVFFWQATVATVTTDGFVQSPLGWAETSAESVWSHLYTAYYLLYAVIGLGSMWLWGRRSSIVARRKQTRLMLVTGLAAIGLGSVPNRILPMLEIHVVPAIAPLFLVVWSVGIWRGMARYNLMMMSASVAAEQILATMSEAVLLMGPDNRILSLNRAASRLLDREEPALIGANVKDLFPAGHVSTTQVLRHADLTKSDLEREFAYTRSDGTQFDLFVTTSTVYDRFGQVVGVVMILRDITLQKRAQERLAHLAHHDSLTGLPNRMLLQDRLERTVAHVKRYGKCAAIVLLDLDTFKEVNDTLGHDHGDVLLQLVAARLQRCVRVCDTVARMGGDEFVLVLGELTGAEDARVVAGRVLASFESELDVKGNRLHITPSIGIALCPTDSERADELLRLADIAMYESKRRGRNTHTFFEPRLLTAVKHKATLESLLRSALREDQFVLHYQPLFDLRTGRAIGVEALLRWKHPTKGLMPPLEFIPAAESAALMGKIGEWVLLTACSHLRRWSTEYGFDLWVAVNLTCRQFADPGLPTSVAEVLRKTALAPEKLQLEIAGSTLGQTPDGPRILTELKRMGLRLALDNFGAGYSSLTDIRGVPFDSIKIDRSLIATLADDPACSVIVAAAIAVAHQYGLTVVAEGIEQEAQLKALKALRNTDLRPLVCDHVQGYLFGRPVPPSEIPEILRKSLPMDDGAVA